MGHWETNRARILSGNSEGFASCSYKQRVKHCSSLLFYTEIPGKMENVSSGLGQCHSCGVSSELRAASLASLLGKGLNFVKFGSQDVKMKWVCRTDFK